MQNDDVSINISPNVFRETIIHFFAYEQTAHVSMSDNTEVINLSRSTTTSTTCRPSSSKGCVLEID